MTFEDDFDRIVEDLSKEKKPEPIPKNTIGQIIMDMDKTTYGFVGLLTSGRLTSQQQIKLRKEFTKFADDMVKLSNPKANVIMTNQINAKRLKEKMLKDMK